MTWCLESSNGRSSDKSPCLMLQRSLSIRWSSPWRNHRWSRTVDGSLKPGEKTSWGRLVVEIPSFTTGFSTIPGGCLGWNWENQWRFDKPTISQFFTDGKAQNSQRTSPFGSSRRPGEAQIMPKTSQSNIPQNPTSYVGNIILQHTSTSKTPWKNVNRFRFHPVSPFTKNCPPKSPWRTRYNEILSCEILWQVVEIHRGIAGREQWEVLPWPDDQRSTVREVSRKSENPRMWRKKIWKMVKMPAKCGRKGHWHGGKST